MVATRAYTWLEGAGTGSGVGCAGVVATRAYTWLEGQYSVITCSKGVAVATRAYTWLEGRTSRKTMNSPSVATRAYTWLEVLSLLWKGRQPRPVRPHAEARRHDRVGMRYETWKTQ